jgi:RNA polymerase sigma-70 factor (ECF subfamily)
MPVVGVKEMAAPMPVVGVPGPFDAFYLREYPRMVALAYAVCGSAVAAEDLAQEALIRAYRRWDRISRYDKPGAWVRRLTLNLAASALRRRIAEAKALARLGPPHNPLPDPEPRQEELWQEVRALSRRQRQAVALFYVEGLAVTEVAEILGCAEGTAKAHLHRARRALAEALRDHGSNSYGS